MPEEKFIRNPIKQIFLAHPTIMAKCIHSQLLGATWCHQRLISATSEPPPIARWQNNTSYLINILGIGRKEGPDYCRSRLLLVPAGSGDPHPPRAQEACTCAQVKITHGWASHRKMFYFVFVFSNKWLDQNFLENVARGAQTQHLCLLASKCRIRNNWEKGESLLDVICEQSAF